MKRTRRKPKPIIDLHLRVWNPRIGGFVKEQAELNYRPITVQVALMLEDAINHATRCKESANA